jgi:hypothetical protein
MEEHVVEEYFVLDEHGEPRREPDPEAWMRWFEHADRGVARTSVTPHVTVLTTFRGVNLFEPGLPPRLFETRVFGGVLDGEERQTPTRSEAMAVHTELAEWCRIGNAPNAGITEDTLQ